MHKLISLLVVAVLAFSIAGCHIAYTPDVQQGNLLSKEMVGQLKPGMTKHQVLVLLGTPSVRTPFDNSRWDYVSTQSHRGGTPKVRTFELTFNNDTLVRTEGDFFAQDPQQLIKESKKYNAGYPATETQGDKSKAPDNNKGDGGLGQGTDNGH